MRYITPLVDTIMGIHMRLTRLSEKEPLNKLSLAVVIFLDVFVFCVIMAGLSEQVSLLWTPEQYVPSLCHTIVIDESAADTREIDRINTLSSIMKDYPVYSYGAALSKKEKEMREHPICREVDMRIETIRQSITLSRLFDDREKVAYSQQDSSSTTASITAAPEYQSLWQYVLADGHAATLDHDLLIDQWWYSVKRFGMELIFLLPLCGVVWWWGARSVRLGNTLQTLVSSHLLVISGIPLLICIIEEVTAFIPRVILEKIWKWLQQYDIAGIWHYFLVLVGIVVALLIIYLIQRKFSDPERIRTARLAASACYDCGKKLPGDCIACPFCSARQYRVCRYCRRDTYVAGRYCRDCGLEE